MRTIVMLPLVFLVAASAQPRSDPSLTGIIMGQVLNGDDAVVADVDVTLYDQRTRTRRTARTDREGVFLFRGMQFGSYQLSLGGSDLQDLSLTAENPNAIRVLRQQLGVSAGSGPGPSTAPARRKKAKPPRIIIYRPPPSPASPPFPSTLPPAPPPAAPPPKDNLQTKTIYFATNRAVKSGPEVDTVSFLGLPSMPNKMTYGTCEVNIPIDHVYAQLEVQDAHYEPDPAKHFFVKKQRTHEHDEFFDLVKAAVLKSSKREAFLFVHGYNVTFENAALRTAQMAVDLKFDGVPIFFSWPSMGRLTGYNEDERSVQGSVEHLRDFLQDLADHTGATRIHLIAHSMGNRALANAVAELGAGQHQRKLFQHIVLAAPDLAVDDFDRLSKAIRSTTNNLTLYASSQDKALLASWIIHGERRLGQGGWFLFVNPILDTVDASNIYTDFLDHSYFANSASILSDLLALVIQDETPPNRKHLQKKNGFGGTYWEYVNR